MRTSSLVCFFEFQKLVAAFGIHFHVFLAVIFYVSVERIGLLCPYISGPEALFT